MGKTLGEKIKEFKPFKSDDIVRGKKLGEGAFGAVFQGTLKIGKSQFDVALKRLAVEEKDMTDPKKYEKLMDNFLNELSFLCKTEHKNLLHGVGVWQDTSDKAYYMVMELVEGKAGDTWIKEQFSDRESKGTIKDLLNIAVQTARGCQALTSAQTVHRDIALRNIMINKNNKDVKVCDYGLAKKMGSDHCFKNNGQILIPVHWSAPESLCHHDSIIEKSDMPWVPPPRGTQFQTNKWIHMFNEKSDVYMFGILLFELFSSGLTPHSGSRSNVEIAWKAAICAHTHHLDGEGEASKHWFNVNVDDLAEPVGALIHKCLAYSPNSRPTWTEVISALEGIMKSLDSKLLDCRIRKWDRVFAEYKAEHGQSRRPPTELTRDEIYDSQEHQKKEQERHFESLPRCLRESLSNPSFSQNASPMNTMRPHSPSRFPDEGTHFTGNQSFNNTSPMNTMRPHSPSRFPDEGNYMQTCQVVKLPNTNLRPDEGTHFTGNQSFNNTSPMNTWNPSTQYSPQPGFTPTISVNMSSPGVLPPNTPFVPVDSHYPPLNNQQVPYSQPPQEIFNPMQVRRF